jgi:hypothetical protein
VGVLLKYRSEPDWDMVSLFRIMSNWCPFEGFWPASLASLTLGTTFVLEPELPPAGGG